MPSIRILLQAVALTSFSYVLWRILRPFVVKSPLSRIPGPPKAHWLKGNFHKIFNKQGFHYHINLFREYGSVVKMISLFGKEELYVADPRALHHIIVKDQYTYEETDVFITNNSLTFGTSLLSTLGEHHKKQRKMLNPVFSLKHMRGLLPIFHPIAHQLVDVLKQKVQRGEEEINMLRWISRAALEYIGQGGLGYTFEALDEGKVNTYSELVKALGPLFFKTLIFRQFTPYVVKIGSPAFRRKLVEWAPSENLQMHKKVVDLIYNTSYEILEEKKEAMRKGDESVLANQMGKGQDIMSILLKANAVADESDKLPEEEVLGQMSTFIFAGHETTSGAICRTLHLLSLHPDVQHKLRVEVSQAVKENGDVPYDVLMSLPYLDAVCRETLRVYPPVPMVKRTARKDIVMPLLYPLKTTDGKEITEIPVPKGTDILVGILATNHSKAIWGEDADEWKPERWLQPLPESVGHAHLPGVYSNLMTFIGGGRACIGFKFAEMELKLMLTTLLTNFEFSISKEIFWNMSGLMAPVLKGSDDPTPQMPLKVTLVKS